MNGPTGTRREAIEELLASFGSEITALKAEVLELRAQLESIWHGGPWPPAGSTDELLGLELVHEYNTRSA